VSYKSNLPNTHTAVEPGQRIGGSNYVTRKKWDAETWGSLLPKGVHSPSPLTLACYINLSFEPFHSMLAAFLLGRKGERVGG
jgi:hypothetical protein